MEVSLWGFLQGISLGISSGVHSTDMHAKVILGVFPGDSFRSSFWEFLQEFHQGNLPKVLEIPSEVAVDDFPEVMHRDSSWSFFWSFLKKSLLEILLEVFHGDSSSDTCSSYSGSSFGGYFRGYLLRVFAEVHFEDSPGISLGEFIEEFYLWISPETPCGNFTRDTFCGLYQFPVDYSLEVTPGGNPDSISKGIIWVIQE